MSARIMDAVERALSHGGWREEDIIGLLNGCARNAKGSPWAVCERCGRMEYEDGLIPTEVIDDGDGGAPVYGGLICPPCKCAQSGGET